MGVKVLITDGMAQAGIDILEKNSAVEFDIDHRKETPADELAQIIDQYEGIVIRSATTLTPELIKKASNMKLIVRAGAGVDNIDVPTATDAKIPVMNTASANSQAAAEQTIALLFSMFRQIPKASQSMAEGRWDRKLYKGHEVTGKVLGVIGLGNIGRIVVDKAIGLGMTVIGHDPTVKSLSEQPSLAKHGSSIQLVQSVDEVLSACDVLTLHVPKIEATKNLINADTLAKMKKGSWLINCARGGIVDEKAVMDAVDSGQLKGAAFDVFEKEPPEFPNPLFSHKDIICAPHLGASTVEAQERVALTAAEQMVGFFSKGDRTGVIN